MNILPDLLNQTCVYWPKGEADRFGKHGFGSPVELPCKWKSGVSRNKNREATTYTASATVYLSSEVQLDGWLWKGLLEDAPDEPPKEFSIKDVDRTDDTENDETLWVALV